MIDFTIERQRHRGFVGRTAALARLDQMLIADRADRWVVVTGGPGMGKSALLAEWLRQREAAGAVVPHHFIRRGEYDWDDPAKLVDSLVAQIEARFPDQREPDADARMHPAARLAATLGRVSERELVPRGEQLVVLIDGLDEYDPPTGARTRDPLAAFLPHALPRSVSLLCASRPRHPYVDMLATRGAVQIDLDDERAFAADNEATVRAFWEQAAPELGLDAQFIAEAIARAKGNLQHAAMLRQHLVGLPLEQHRALDIPRGLAALLDQAWEQIATDSVVVDGLGILCAAREALTLDELSASAGWTGAALRRTFVRGARKLLVENQREGAVPEYRLHHDSIREQIAGAIGMDALRGYHRALARQLATWPAPPERMARRYALRHALIHRVEAGEWADAWCLAADMGFVEAKCRELGVHDTEADLARVAERCRASGDETLRRRFDDLSRALGRESHWLRVTPEATAALLWNRLRQSGWSTDEIEQQVQLPARSQFLRVRHLTTRESPALVRDLVGHTDVVTACAVTPDGRRVVSASGDYTLKVWDLETGRALATLKGHAWPVNACAVTPDGRRVVSASEDSTLKVWDLETGRALATLKGHADRVTACAVPPDGRRVVSASEDKTFKVWDLETGRALATFKGHAARVTACAVAPDGRRVVSASNDKTLKVWDLETGRALATLKGHADSVTACAVTRGGQQVVSASLDETLKVWNLETGRAVATLEGHAESVTACAVPPDGRRVVSASSDKTLKVWSLETGCSVATLEGHTASVTACAVTPDGRRAVSASWDKTLKVWDPETGRMVATLKGHADSVTACVVTPDGRPVVSGFLDKTLKVWDLETGRVVTTMKGHADRVTACAVTPDGRRVVSASEDETFKVWDLETGRTVATLKSHDSWVTACAVTQDGRRVVSTWGGTTLKAWDLETGRAVAAMQGHDSLVTACAVTPDGRRVVSASLDGTLKVWDLETGRAVATLEGHADCVTACAVTPDGRRVVSASDDKTLKVWDLETGACLITHRANTAYTAVTTTATAVIAGDVVGSVWFLGWSSPNQPESSSRGDRSPDNKPTPSSDAELRSQALEQALEQRRALDIPRGLAALLDQAWERIATDPVVVDGLGILCAAREALTLDELSAVAGWTGAALRRTFVRGARELLVENQREGAVPEYRLHHESIRGQIAAAIGMAALREHHRALARQLATWPAPPERMARRYALRHALIHRVEAGEWADAWRLAADMGFVETKCREIGVHEAEVDIARAAERCRASGDETLCRQFDDLARALGRESHWLRAAPEATAALLWNRLRQSGWSADQIEQQLQLPTGPQFLRVRHLATRESPALVRDLLGHAHCVIACAVTPDGRRVVSASEDNTLKVWDLQTGRALVTLEGHSAVAACAVTPDGRRVVSASEDDSVKIWDLETGRALATLENHANHAELVTACAVTPDGRRVVSAWGDDSLKVWDLETGRTTATLEGHTSLVTACVVTPGGQSVVSASDDETLKVWDLETGRTLATLIGHASAVTACAATPDGQRVISASKDQTLKVWDLATGHALTTMKGHADSVTACAVTPDGRRVVSASLDETLKVWDLETGRALATLKGHASAVTACAVTPDGRWVVSASEDDSLKVWDLQTERAPATMEGHTSWVYACAVTPDGRRVVSASQDKKLKVWDLQTGRALATLEGHNDIVNACAVAPDGRRMVSASWDHTLKVWDLETGRALATLKGHADGVTACAVTPDGRRVVSASDDKTLKVWDLQTRRALATLNGHASKVYACALTPDGRWVVSASWDQTIKVWDLETSACCFTHRANTACTAITTTTTAIIAGDAAGSVWFLDWPSLQHRAGSFPDGYDADNQRSSSLDHEPPSARPSMKHTVLFLAANPSGTDRIALDEEARAIQVELERSGFRDCFELVTRWAVTPLDLLRELRKLKPTVVHFSGSGPSNPLSENWSGPAMRSDVVSEPGHNGGDPQLGLLFQGSDGRPQLVSTEALEETFGAAGASVKLVVLSACYSEVQAKALLPHVSCVVGMSSSIRDVAARSFSIGFYGGLGERESIATAFKQGCAAISLEGLRDRDRPQLAVCAGVDAGKLILAAGVSDPHARHAGASTAAASQPSRPSARSAAPPTVDIGVLTIRYDEFLAVLDAFPSEGGIAEGKNRKYALRHADIGNGQQYTIAVLRQIEQGNGEAQAAARDLIEDLAPKLVLVVGIAGGLPSDDVKLGDVVLSTQIHDFTVEASKYGEKTAYAVKGGSIVRSLAADVAILAARGSELGNWAADLPSQPGVNWTRKGQLYGPKEWRTDLRDKLEHHYGRGSTPRAPIFRAGPIASSDRLVKDPDLVLPWLATSRDLLAIEMESGGVYRAAQERCPMLAIRGISDIVGLKRADDWTKYACASAAAFTRAFLRTRPVPVGASVSDPS